MDCLFAVNAVKYLNAWQSPTIILSNTMLAMICLFRCALSNTLDSIGGLSLKSPTATLENLAVPSIEAETDGKAGKSAKNLNRKSTSKYTVSMIGEKHAVIAALENPQYTWRTIKGLAEEANIEPANVESIIAECGDTIVRSSAVSVDGARLYMTRKRYRKSTGVLARLCAAMRNRAD
jgi:hypothetical protein